MAAHDATTTQAGSGADFDHTPSGTPSLARVSVHMRPGGTDTLITGITYGGEAMTRKLHIDTNGDTTPGGNNQDFVEIWTLEDPPSGQQTVSITRTGTAPDREVYICSTYTGTGTVGTAVTDSDNSNSYKTVGLTGISSETGGIVLDALTTQENEDHTPDEDNTGNERADLSDSSNFRGCSSDADGAGSVDMGWSWSTKTRFAYAAIPVAAGASGPDAATISEGTGTDDQNAMIDVDSYDGSADSHDLYRSTSSMSGDPEANGTLVGPEVDPADPVVDSSVSPDTLYYFAIVSRDTGGDTPSNEISFRTAPARPHVVWQGENLIGEPDMDTDPDEDGVVDGFNKAPSGSHTVSFDVSDEAQRIQVTGASGSGGSSIFQWTDVTEDVEYTLIFEVKLENPVGDFGGRVLIQWFDSGETLLDTDETSFTNESYQDVSVTATAPTGATQVKARVTAASVASGDTGSLYARHGRFYSTDYYTGDEATISWHNQTETRAHVVYVNGVPVWTTDPGEEKAVLSGLTPGEEVTITVLAQGPSGELSGFDTQVVLGSTAEGTFTPGQAVAHASVDDPSFSSSVAASIVEQRVITLPAGSEAYTFYGLEEGTEYVVKVRHVDHVGGVGPFASENFITDGSPDVAPAFLRATLVVGEQG